MTWKEFVYQLIIEHCRESGAGAFSLRDFYETHKAEMARFAPDNHHIAAKVRQQIQFLRKDGLLNFVDNRGSYELSGESVLKVETARPIAEPAPLTDTREREYLDEISGRDRSWARIARKIYGDECLIPSCANHFLKDDDTAYIEVHHIDAYSEQRREAIWNLSVVCAHHHRMAHFAKQAVRLQIRETLIARTQSLLARPQ